MNDITIPRELAEEFCKERFADIWGNIDAVVKMKEYIRSQLNPALSDRELFLKVMRGEWQVKELGKYFSINAKTGEIYNNDGEAFTAYIVPKLDGTIYTAPTKELAEKLRDVILGKYKPTFQDISERVRFWVHGGYGGDLDYSFPILSLGEHQKYFFTKEQRDSFARQQEEKREPGNIDNSFYISAGAYCFGNETRTDYDISDHLNFIGELNRIRTELNRLSQRFPKE